ncbi:MAG: hypothetical protein ABI200_03495 [Gaiellales bacterium]
MDELTTQPTAMTPTRTRHDIVSPQRSRVDARVIVRSFELGGPSTLVDRFVAVGLRLQAETPMRVPTSEATIRHRLSADFGWYRTGTARHFVASIDGRDVGRCSAMLDPAHRDDDGRLIGCIGQWECEDGDDGSAAAYALLELSTAWLRGSSAKDIIGPIDFSTWYGYRFRDGVGDGRDPLLLEPITPNHALEQWLGFGFVRDETYFSAEIADPEATLEMARPVSAQLLENGWKIRQLRMSEWDELIEQAHAMSMTEFTRQPYFTPISLEDFRATYAGVKAGVDPRYVLTAWSPENEFAGYVFGVRNLAAAARAVAAGGVGGKLRAAREAWRADTLMVKTICVGRRFREHGIAILLQTALYDSAIDTGHTRICNMLMHANNRSRMLTEISGGVEFRSYVTLRLTA